MPCGECGECCKAFAIPGLKKAAGVTCRHFNSGAKCTVYADRPQTCRAYQCLWLKMSEDKRFDNPSPALRPDRCGVIIDIREEREGSTITLTVDPKRPESINDPQVAEVALSLWKKTGFQVVGVLGNNAVEIKPRVEK